MGCAALGPCFSLFCLLIEDFSPGLAAPLPDDSGWTYSPALMELVGSHSPLASPPHTHMHTCTHTFCPGLAAPLPDDSGWTYSPALVELVGNYRARFPWVFHALENSTGARRAAVNVKHLLTLLPHCCRAVLRLRVDQIIPHSQRVALMRHH